jgi:hypothetical protein
VKWVRALSYLHAIILMMIRPHATDTELATLTNRTVTTLCRLSYTKYTCIPTSWRSVLPLFLGYSKKIKHSTLRSILLENKDIILLRNVGIYHSTRHHIPEDGNFHRHSCGDLKSHTYLPQTRRVSYSSLPICSNQFCGRTSRAENRFQWLFPQGGHRREWSWTFHLTFVAEI